MTEEDASDDGKTKHPAKKGKGKGKEYTLPPDLSEKIKKLSREIPEDKLDYFKMQCELMILEYEGNEIQFERMRKGLTSCFFFPATVS